MKRRDFVTGAITGAVVGAGATILAKSTTLQPGTPSEPGKIISYLRKPSRMENGNYVAQKLPGTWNRRAISCRSY